MRRHKYRGGEAEANFDELNFKEQAQSITAAINQLGFKIDANLRRAREEGRDEQRILEMRLAQVERMLNRRRRRQKRKNNYWSAGILRNTKNVGDNIRTRISLMSLS